MNKDTGYRELTYCLVCGEEFIKTDPYDICSEDCWYDQCESFKYRE